MSDSGAHVETTEVEERQQAEVQDAATHADEPTTLTPALSQREREDAAEEPGVVMPEVSTGMRAAAVRAEHPAGEMFFRGTAEEVTESEAEQIARRQLERSGLLRGQKVRVAD